MTTPTSDPGKDRSGRRPAGPAGDPGAAGVPGGSGARGARDEPGKADGRGKDSRGKDGRGKGPKDAKRPASAAERNVVGWTALLVAVVLTVWQAISSLTLGGIDPGDRQTFSSVSIFVALILGLAAAVLGIVGLAQRLAPRWPALVGLAVGLYAFVGALFSWIGGLMNTGA